MSLDDQLRGATDELRDQLGHVPVGEFRPNRPVGAIAAAALLLIVGLVAFAGWQNRSEDAQPLDVFTQPEDTQPVDTPVDSTEPVDTGAQPRVGQLTTAAPGEFVLPMPGVSAWNATESLMLLYRTGDTPTPGHVVVDTATGQTVAEVSITAPDIEQIYWHPALDDTLVAFEGDQLITHDVRTGQTDVVATIDTCTSITAGNPSPPSTTGRIVALCDGGDAGSSTTAVVDVDLTTGDQRQFELGGAFRAVQVSPSGTHLLGHGAEGTIHVLDLDGVPTGATFDIGGAVLVLTTGASGVDQAVVAQFEGDTIGSVVVVPLDGSDARVVVGPANGDPYPPSGSQLSVAGDRVALSTAGPVDEGLAGRLVSVARSDAAASPVVASRSHDSTGAHGYWSNAFVSLSPSGRWIAYSSDVGGPSVNTFIATFAD